MAKTLVLTFIADDRPGLVECLAETIAAEGGNWLESKMANLAEKFAGIVKIEIPETVGDKASSVEMALTALNEKGFHLTISLTHGTPEVEGAQFEILLEGLDHPGIVRDISSCLTEHGASIEEMETETRDTPISGGSLFCARVRVRLPVGLDKEKIRHSLELLSSELMVDITIDEVAA